MKSKTFIEFQNFVLTNWFLEQSLANMTLKGMAKKGGVVVGVGGKVTCNAPYFRLKSDGNYTYQLLYQ